MDITGWIAVASLVGAGLFFASGYLARGVRTPKRPIVPPLSPVDSRLEDEQAARQRAELEVAELRRQVSQLAEAAREDVQLAKADQEETTAVRAEEDMVQRLRHEVASLHGQLKREEEARSHSEKALREARSQLRAAETQASQMRSRLAEGERVALDLEKTRRELRDALDKQRQAATGAKGADALRVEVDRLRERAQTLEADLVQARQAGRQVDQLQKEAQQAKQQAEQGSQSLAEAERQIGELRFSLEQKDAALAAAQREQASQGADSADGIEQVRGTLRDVQVKLQVAEAKAAQADALHDQIAQLRADAVRMGSEAVPVAEVDELRKQQRELQLKSQMLQERVQQLQHYADENAAMKSRLSEADAVSQREQALQQQVKDLEARLFATGMVVAAAAAPESEPEEQATLLEPTMGGSIDSQLTRLASGPDGYRVAVLADTRGLLLGGSGDEQYFEALAGMSGLIRQLTERAREFLPLGVPHLVEIADTNEVGLRARLFPWENDFMTLSTLGGRRAPLDPHAESVIASLITVMRSTRAGGADQQHG